MSSLSDQLWYAGQLESCWPSHAVESKVSANNQRWCQLSWVMSNLATHKPSLTLLSPGTVSAVTSPGAQLDKPRFDCFD